MFPLGGLIWDLFLPLHSLYPKDRTMRILIGYDVCTLEPEGRRRLRRICQACKDYGQRVQKSLFEVEVAQRHWVELRDRLFRIFFDQEDSLRFYFLDEDTHVEHYGQAKPVDLDGPLIF